MAMCFLEPQVTVPEGELDLSWREVALPIMKAYAERTGGAEVTTGQGSVSEIECEDECDRV